MSHPEAFNVLEKRNVRVVSSNEKDQNSENFAGGIVQKLDQQVTLKSCIVGDVSNNFDSVNLGALQDHQTASNHDTTDVDAVKSLHFNCNVKDVSNGSKQDVEALFTESKKNKEYSGIEPKCSNQTIGKEENIESENNSINIDPKIHPDPLSGREILRRTVEASLLSQNVPKTKSTKSDTFLWKRVQIEEPEKFSTFYRKNLKIADSWFRKITGGKDGEYLCEVNIYENNIAENSLNQLLDPKSMERTNSLELEEQSPFNVSKNYLLSNSKKCINENYNSIFYNDIVPTQAIEKALINDTNIETRDFYDLPHDDQSSTSLNSCENVESTYGSALSSNDLMTPFGTPRNASSISSSLSSSLNMGLNYASLISENIPNSLNGMKMYEANINEINNNVFKRNDHRNKYYFLRKHEQYHRNRNLRKLLNLTSHKVKYSKSLKEHKIVDKGVFDKLEFSSDPFRSTKPDSVKPLSSNLIDIKTNLKKFYNSRRCKAGDYGITSLNKSNRTNSGKNNQNINQIPSCTKGYDNGKCRIDTKINETFNKKMSILNNGKCVKGVNLTQEQINPQILEISSSHAESKLKKRRKFVSRIPRPIPTNRRERTQNNYDHIFDKDSLLNFPLADGDNTVLSGCTSKRNENESVSNEPTRLSNRRHVYSPAATKDDQELEIESSKASHDASNNKNMRSKYWQKHKLDPVRNISVKNEYLKTDNKCTTRSNVRALTCNSSRSLVVKPENKSTNTRTVRSQENSISQDSIRPRSARAKMFKVVKK